MKQILAKALLFLSVLSIGVAAVPDKQFSLDVQNSTQTWELKWIYTGTTPLLRGMLTKNGTEWKPSSDWAGFFWYGTNSSWGSGGTTKLAGTFSTNNAYIDFQAISTTFPTSGLFYGGVVMTNGTQSIEWGVGKVFVRDSGGISGAGTLSLKETVNWDLIDTYTGTWPFYFNYADADTNGFSSTTYPTGVVITARFSTNSNVTGYSNFVESTYYPRSNPSNFLNSGSAGLLYDALGAAAGASNGVVSQIVSSNYYPSSNPSNFISTDATNSLPNYLLRSGANAMTGKLNMGGNDITNCTGLFLGSAGWYIYAGNMQDEPYWSDGFVLERMWTSGNGGSGSGLDADTVDGVHAASFLPLAGGTMTGPLVGITSQLYRVTGYAGGTTVAVTDYGSSLDMYPGGDGFAGGSVRLWNDHPQNSPATPVVSIGYKSTNLVVNGTLQSGDITESGTALSGKYASIAVTNGMLRADGTVPMAGTLDLAGNNLTNGGTLTATNVAVFGTLSGGGTGGGTIDSNGVLTWDGFPSWPNTFRFVFSSILGLYECTNAAGGTSINLYRSGGTYQSPSVCSNGWAGYINLREWDGDSWVISSRIAFEADETASLTSTAARIAFLTVPNGSQTLSERMRITSAGLVGINDTTPSAHLDVNGHAQVQSNLTVRGSLTLGASNLVLNTGSYLGTNGIYFINGTTTNWLLFQ